MTETERFMLHISERVPALSDLFREHQREYDEMLPHVLMGDLTRAAMQFAEDAQAGASSAATALQCLLDELEHGLQSGGKSVEELVVVSFLENLDEDDPRFQELEKHFGPQLRWEWSQLDSI